MSGFIGLANSLSNSIISCGESLVFGLCSVVDANIQNCWRQFISHGAIFSNAEAEPVFKNGKKHKNKEEKKESVQGSDSVIQSQNIFIGVINGMNNLFSDAKKNAEYLESFIPKLNTSVDLTYNESHGIIRDLGEVFLMNYGGISPTTVDDLIIKWHRFFLKHRDNPSLKLLHFCHSQGAIHTRNALMHLPLMVRNRIIVVAIAPAAIIPRELCYKSFNYASKRDIVPYGELAYRGFFDPQECGASPVTQQVLNWNNQLILLEPHPDEKGMGHDFQNPTFSEKIKNHIMEYLLLKGMYR